MKLVYCKRCLKSWYINDEDKKSIKLCPFCGISTKEPKVYTNMNTLSDVLYKVAYDYGAEIFNSKERVFGYLDDFLPTMSKKVHIFKKAFNNKSMLSLKKAFNQELDEAELTINKIRIHIVEEEGIAETWADFLCDECFKAIKYYKGELPENTFIEIRERDFNKNEILDSRGERLDKSNIMQRLVNVLNSKEIKEFIRLSSLDWKAFLGKSVRFGKTKGYYGTWTVLDANANVTLLLYDGIHLMNNYNNKGVEFWCNCSLRKWLNQDFFEETFSKEEKQAILESGIGDKVFCLSEFEVKKYKKYVKTNLPPWFLRNECSCNPIVFDSGIIREVAAQRLQIVRPAIYIFTDFIVNNMERNS